MKACAIIASIRPCFRVAAAFCVASDSTQAAIGISASYLMRGYRSLQTVFTVFYESFQRVMNFLKRVHERVTRRFSWKLLLQRARKLGRSINKIRANLKISISLYTLCKKREEEEIFQSTKV